MGNVDSKMRISNDTSTNSSKQEPLHKEQLPDPEEITNTNNIAPDHTTAAQKGAGKFLLDATNHKVHEKCSLHADLRKEELDKNGKHAQAQKNDSDETHENPDLKKVINKSPPKRVEQQNEPGEKTQIQGNDSGSKSGNIISKPELETDNDSQEESVEEDSLYQTEHENGDKEEQKQHAQQTQTQENVSDKTHNNNNSKPGLETAKHEDGTKEEKSKNSKHTPEQTINSDIYDRNNNIKNVTRKLTHEDMDMKKQEHNLPKTNSIASDEPDTKQNADDQIKIANGKKNIYKNKIEEIDVLITKLQRVKQLSYQK